MYVRNHGGNLEIRFGADDDERPGARREIRLGRLDKLLASGELAGLVQSLSRFLDPDAVAERSAGGRRAVEAVTVPADRLFARVRSALNGRYGYVELVSDGHATKAKQAVIARLGSWRTYKGHPEAFDRRLSSLTKLQGRARAKEE